VYNIHLMTIVNALKYLLHTVTANNNDKPTDCCNITSALSITGYQLTQCVVSTSEIIQSAHTPKDVVKMGTNCWHWYTKETLGVKL